jgi:hypothetical protein
MGNLLLSYMPLRDNKVVAGGDGMVVIDGRCEVVGEDDFGIVCAAERTGIHIVIFRYGHFELSMVSPELLKHVSEQ